MRACVHSGNWFEQDVMWRTGTWVGARAEASVFRIAYPGVEKGWISTAIPIASAFVRSTFGGKNACRMVIKSPRYAAIDSRMRIRVEYSVISVQGKTVTDISKTAKPIV